MPSKDIAMGGCLSSESQHDAGDADHRQRVAFQDDARAESNDRRRQLGNSKGSSATFSLMRVRSHVVRSVLEPGTGKKQWAAARASTYDHVHEVVLSNFLQDDVDRKAGVCGLINLGNTCFMNSSLQCLMNTIPLTDYFLGYDYRSEINRDNFLGTGGELVTAYASLVKEMWLGKKKAVEPSAFKAKLEAFAPQFYGTEQQDSQELLSCLLDGVHEDLNRVKKKPYIEDKDCDGTNDEGDAVLAWQNYLQRDRSIIVDLFQGQLRNEIRCSECNHTSVKFDAFMYLSLPVSDTCHSIDDCLDLFCAAEVLAGENQWYCSKCKRHVDATKKFDLWTLPPILIVHLKRFKFTRSGRKKKIDRQLKYPLEGWNLSRSMKSNHGSAEKDSYDLYAVSNHSGGDLGFGHYTAMALNRFDDCWYDFNDSSSQKIDVSKSDLGSSSKCYLLFYNRVEPESAIGGESTRSARETTIRRQDVDRPELWPHMQNAASAAVSAEVPSSPAHMQIQKQNYRSFARSTRSLEISAASAPPPGL